MSAARPCRSRIYRGPLPESGDAPGRPPDREGERSVRFRAGYDIADISNLVYQPKEFRRVMNMDWEQLFAASASKLKADLDQARAAVAHSGLKGTLNETAFANWLRQYLPRTLEVSAGEIIDSVGSRSRQIDVAIYDAASTPRFLSRDQISVIPVEPVFAVIEVKTYLNKLEMGNAFENMNAVKRLQKLAFHQTINNTIIKNTTIYGIEQSIWPLQFYIFAYESDGLDTLLSHVARLNASQPLSRQIDCVCVLDKGLLVHAGPEGLQPLPMPNTQMIAKNSAKPLLTFYALLAHLYGQAFTKPIAIHPYLAHIKH